MDRLFDPAARYRFVFNFTHEGCTQLDPDGLVKLFQFTNLNKDSYERLVAMVDQEQEDYEIFRDDTESDYGVHDFSTTGDEELVGFSSYEVEPSKTDKVINDWRQFFTGQGFCVGPVETYFFANYQHRYQQ